MLQVKYNGEVVEVDPKVGKKLIDQPDGEGVIVPNKAVADKLQQAIAIERWKLGYRLPSPFDAYDAELPENL